MNTWQVVVVTVASIVTAGCLVVLGKRLIFGRKSVTDHLPGTRRGLRGGSVEFARQLHEAGLIPDPVRVKSIDIHADGDTLPTITTIVYLDDGQLDIVRKTLDELRRPDAH